VRDESKPVGYARAAHQPEPLNDGLTPTAARLEERGMFVKTWECMTGHRSTQGRLCPTCQRHMAYIRRKKLAGEPYVAYKIPAVGWD